MTHIIPKDIRINETIAKLAIEKSFTLEVKSISILGEGWDNEVYLVNKQFVFRFARRKVALKLLQREMWVLTKLKDQLNLSLPVPQYSSVGNSYYTYPFYGHKLIKGVTGCRISLTSNEYHKAAIKLASFLKKLHSLEINTLKNKNDQMEAIFDRVDIRVMHDRFNERFSEVQKHYDLSPYQNKISKIKSLATGYKTQNKLALVHGDLYHRHLVFNDNNALTGIIDWGDCCVSDPVIDLGILYQFFPAEIHTHFWDTYGKVDLPMRNYARFLGVYYAIALLWYGHDRKDKDLIQDSLKTLEMI